MAKQIITEIATQAHKDADAWEAAGEGSEIANVYTEDANDVRGVIDQLERWSNLDDFIEELYDLDTIVREAMYDTIMLAEKWSKELEQGIFY